MAKRKYNVKGTKDFIVLAAIFFFLCIWAVKDAWFPSAKVLKKHPHQIAASFAVAGTIDEILVGEGDSVGKNQVIARLRTERVRTKFDTAKEAYGEAKKKHTLLEVTLENTAEAAEGRAGVEENLAGAKLAMDAAHAEVTRLNKILDASELVPPEKGSILEFRADTLTMLGAVTADFAGKVTMDGKGAVKVIAEDGTEKRYEMPEGYNLLRASGDMVEAGDAVASQIVCMIKPGDHFYLFNKSLAIVSFFAFWIFLVMHLFAR